MNDEPTIEEKVRAAFVVQWEDEIAASSPPAADTAKPSGDATDGGRGRL